MLALQAEGPEFELPDHTFKKKKDNKITTTKPNPEAQV